MFSAEDISSIEEKFGRKAFDVLRARPDGTDLKWTKIGVIEITCFDITFMLHRMVNGRPSIKRWFNRF